MTAIASPAQTLTTLYSFSGSTDGGRPQAGLVQGTDGNFYGTTGSTIFEITPGGTLTTLHTFSENETPMGNLIQGSDRKFYGTTYYGGTNNCPASSGNGCGTIYSVVPGGSLVTLYNFCSQPNCADGAGPSAGLVQGADGNFYGTTTDYAFADGCPGSPCGTVFKITPTGTLTTLYTFFGTSGYGPNSALVQGTDGNFYGTTALGGSFNCGTGSASSCGTIFKITPQGTLTILYSFCEQTGCPDGHDPVGLVQGSDGNFYGTTSTAQFNLGTVFKITPSGTLTTLHTFDETDGEVPSTGPIIQGTDGNFYGTTYGGGPNGGGAIFKMTPAGALITLYSFDGTDGGSPNGLVQVTNGSFYGTTEFGGTNNDGTVFSFSIGLDGTATSTTSLSLVPASITAGSTGPVAMTATVAPASGSGTPTGVVGFFIYTSSHALGFANMTGGVATFDYNPSTLAVNSYPYFAIYSGDGTFAGSTSSTETLTITAVPPPPAAATPTFLPAPGTYNSAQTVTLTDTTTDATIYYTNDGTTPTTSSAVYSEPITVNSTETIQAIAGASGYSNSAVASAAYTITLSPDYQLSVTPSTLTIVAGQSGTATFSVTPLDGFSSQVSFACNGLPSGATCSFKPASVIPSDGPASSTLTIATTGASAALRGVKPSSRYLNYALLAPFLGIMFGIAAQGRPAHRSLRVFGLLALVVLATLLTSCASSSKGSPGGLGTPPGSSIVTVMASTGGTGGIKHATTLTVTITQ